MSEARSDLKRLLSSTGVYALAALAQQGVGFLLIPVYTRLIDPQQYGVLELFNAFSSIGFALLTMGLSSAINKCYHRDCHSSGEQAMVLWTAILLDLPVLALAGLLIVAFAGPISGWLTGSMDAQGLVPLVAGAGFFYSVATLVLAGLRAQERAVAFSVLTVTQFTTALGLNLLLVAGYGLGIRGVFWGNLLSNALVLPLAIAVARQGAAFTFNPRLMRPLLTFGLYLIPVMLAGWVMDLSDRYILRLFHGLDEVAVYGVGYKFGMILQVAIVWPFQLAWPAFSFAISHRPGHQVTYARTLTYLTTVLVVSVLGLSLAAKVVLPVLVGTAYRDAYRVIPVVALAYAFNGIQYCVSPGVHIAGRTRYLSVLAAIAAVTNILLNLLLIPRFGMMGAGWSTLVAFLFLAAATSVLAHRVYPIAYEYARLAKVVAAGGLVYLLASVITPGTIAMTAVWNIAVPMIAFPTLLVLTGFLDPKERECLGVFFRRYAPLLS